MTIINDILNEIKEQNIKFVDLRFTDSLGHQHSLTYDADFIDGAVLENGVVFNSSAITGWQDIEASDMLLKPDLSSFVLDPFANSKTAILICNVLCTSTMQNYNRDPRSIAKKAEKFLHDYANGSYINFGCELEFFLFDSVEFSNKINSSSYEVKINEFQSHVQSVNSSHPIKSALQVQPVDQSFNIRSEIIEILKSLNIETKGHHHEISPGQNEISFAPTSLLKCADNIQMAKYVIKNVAHSYGKKASFMAKPIATGNGNSMPLNQAIFKAGKNLFFGSNYAGLSDVAIFYIGGVLKHCRALNAFTNPTTNSYARFTNLNTVPKFISYSDNNRSTAIKVPYSAQGKDKSIEIRFPDSSANIFLALSSILMAGLDGVINKISPGAPEDRNLFNLSMSDLNKPETLSLSLEESLKSLSEDKDFLLKDNVFTDDQLNSYIKIKQDEVEYIKSRPNPEEYETYFSN